MSQLLRPGATQERLDEARTSFLVGAITISNTIKSTLGPRGMLKLLYTSKGEPTVTNDGATVLKSLVPNGPSAKILISLAKEHNENEGDGSTTLTVLTGELLQEADRLIFKGAHPNKIINGYRTAHKKAMALLKDLSFASQTKEEKLNLAMTTLSSKFSPTELKTLAQLAVNVSELTTNMETVNVIKIPGGEVTDSHIDNGLLLECDIGPGQKTKFTNPRVLIVNTAMDADKIKIFGAKAQVKTPKELEFLEEAEKKRMQEKIEQISQYADIIVNRQIIYDYPTQQFTRQGKISIERAGFAGMEMLSRVLNGKILSTFESVQETDIGHCEEFERVKISGRAFTRFKGVPNKGACTIVLRGPSKEILEEAERSILGVVQVLLLNTNEYIFGGGSVEAAVSTALQCTSEGERAYARALLEVTRTLAENAGHSPDETIDTILAKNAEGITTWGVGLEGPTCMKAQKVKESLRLKEIIWTRAAEAAEMILRCDGIIKCKPRERARE
ncbi:T-complex protein 1 subunit beta [Nematocida sp. AWRm80]|nr:T-complex protein 1 subunit beta [Nematocida sp. AWRm80]